LKITRISVNSIQSTQLLKHLQDTVYILQVFPFKLSVNIPLLVSLFTTEHFTILKTSYVIKFLDFRHFLFILKFFFTVSYILSHYSSMSDPFSSFQTKVLILNLFISNSVGIISNAIADSVASNYSRSIIFSPIKIPHSHLSSFLKTYFSGFWNHNWVTLSIFSALFIVSFFLDFKI